jgi:hypothetical protein
VTGLFETDLKTHAVLPALRALAVNEPRPDLLSGGNLYLSYQSGSFVCGRIARIPLSGGSVVQSPWRAFSDAPVVAYGALWVIVNVRPNISDAADLYELSPKSLAIEREITLPGRYDDATPVPADGAIWIGDSRGTVLGRVDARTGKLSFVPLPGLGKYDSAQDVVAAPDAGTLYVLAVKQTSPIFSEAIERFDPATGRFKLNPGTARFPVARLIGVTGDLLWVALMGGMSYSVAPESTTTLGPTRCALEGGCSFGGLNTIFEVTTDGDLAWMSHAGGWLECARGPTGSVSATLRIPAFGPMTAGYSPKDSGLSLIASGEGYLALVPQFPGPGGGDLAPEVALFRLDPRCGT